jgi:hypothetical protein
VKSEELSTISAEENAPDLHDQRPQGLALLVTKLKQGPPLAWTLWLNLVIDVCITRSSSHDQPTGIYRIYRITMMNRLLQPFEEESGTANAPSRVGNV